MIGKDKLIKKLEKVLDKSSADQTEIVFIGQDSGLTRYANSYIHQNVHEQNRKIFFRSVIGKKVGVASTNSMEKADLQKALSDSIEIAKNRPENPDFPGLPKPAKYKKLDTFDDDTAKFSPSDRAKTIKKVIKTAAKNKFTMAGAFKTSVEEIAVLNSLGIRAYQPATSAAINMIAMSDTSSGYASAVSRSVDDIDFGKLSKRAVEKCSLSANPIQLEPGEYEVILEPPAIAEMLEWLNYVSFGSKPYLQGTSFLSGRNGKKITAKDITIYDNALSSKSMAFPFDFEGVPKKKVTFVEKGLVGTAVFDRATAVKGETKSTGHAVTPDEQNDGAFALNIFLKPGDIKRSKMIEKVKRGILVTRFHYLNGFIDTRNAVLTGMTRDGTFLVEDGEIKSGIKNMRFTDSFTRAFGTVKAISKETERIESWWSAVGCVTVPAVHLGSFKFSGKTDF